MRWYHVDGMTPTQLQEKYRLECGVYADRAYLVRWLKVVPEKEQCLGLVIYFSSSLLAGGILLMHFHCMSRGFVLVAVMCHRSTILKAI